MTEETLVSIWVAVAFFGYIYFVIRNREWLPGLVKGILWVVGSGLFIMGFLRYVLTIVT